MAIFEDIVGLLRAAAESTRLRILCLVQTGEFSVKDLTQLLGQSQPRVSRHLKLLGDAGLIERYQEGSWLFVRASDDASVRQFIADAMAMIGKDDAQLVRDAERAQQIRAKRAQFAQAYFNENASQWDRIRSLHVPEPQVEAAILDALGLGPFDLVLDLGTGTGRVLELIADRVRRAVGVDTNREMLRCARVRLDSAQLLNCSVRQADIFDLPFPEASADAVIIHQVLHFLHMPKMALAEATRVLKPNGRLLIADFAPHAFEFLREDHAHVRLGFKQDEMAGWLKECGVSPVSYRELRGGESDEKGLTVALWTALKSQVEERQASKEWRVAS